MNRNLHAICSQESEHLRSRLSYLNSDMHKVNIQLQMERSENIILKRTIEELKLNESNLSNDLTATTQELERTRMRLDEKSVQIIQLQEEVRILRSVSANPNNIGNISSDAGRRKPEARPKPSNQPNIIRVKVSTIPKPLPTEETNPTIAAKSSNKRGNAQKPDKPDKAQKVATKPRVDCHNDNESSVEIEATLEAEIDKLLATEPPAVPAKRAKLSTVAAKPSTGGNDGSKKSIVYPSIDAARGIKPSTVSTKGVKPSAVKTSGTKPSADTAKGVKPSAIKTRGPQPSKAENKSLKPTTVTAKGDVKPPTTISKNAKSSTAFISVTTRF